MEGAEPIVGEHTSSMMVEARGMSRTWELGGREGSRGRGRQLHFVNRHYERVEGTDSQAAVPEAAFTSDEYES